jgi:N-acetylmuramoyl-L-alanine amidase
LSWINRFTAPISRSLPAALLLVASFAVPARADAPIAAVYQRQTIVFTEMSTSAGARTIGINDAGFRTLLRATGATLTWQPGDRYVLMTTAARVVVGFALGDRHYNVGPIGLQASVAPYQRGGDVYLPFDDVVRALDLALRPDGSTIVLQPQLDSLDVRASGNRVDLLAHGGAPLRPRVAAQSASAMTYEFDGVGTPLAGTRNVNAGGIRTLQIVQTGTLRDPKTLVTVQLAPGAVYDVPRSNDDRDIVISFASSAAAAQAPPQVPAPALAAGGTNAATAGAAPGGGTASVTGVVVTPSSDGYSVAIAVTGNAAFEWHRLRDPDNRFWVDVKGAQLQGSPIDTSEPDPVGALRVRQIDAATVRIALSLTGPKSLVVSPSANGLTVDVGQSDAADMARTGSGSVGTVVASNEQAAAVTPAPANPDSSGADSSWKFGGTPGDSGSTYVPKNPHLIVIDPGHGGSDQGAVRNGTTEAGLTLDMAKRLRGILIARGWQVQMTHDTDVDVYAPNDSAHQELQARVDVANNAGARLFVSIHANSFINSGPYGTTCYISKTSDLALARAIDSQLASDGTKDDGIVKSHLYVTLHTAMPAVLVETAFLSNPNDYALLTSPAWRQKLAQAIADGIDRYNRQYPATNQPAQ